MLPKALSRLALNTARDRAFTTSLVKTGQSKLWLCKTNKVYFYCLIFYDFTDVAREQCNLKELFMCNGIQGGHSLSAISNKCVLPYFCGDFPRLLARSKLFSFPVPLVPQPLHIGIGTGAVCAFGGGIFGQILAASTRLFLVGCWDNFSKYMLI